MAACESAFAVAITLGLLVLFRERVARQGRRARWLSGNAFAVYVVHAVVLVALGPAVGAVEAPAAAKAALLVVIGLPLCWAVASLVRALPGVRKVL
jgi:Protein involved in polysaccharide intercellular adhesin (PIA) synthesis/biofilm formation